MNVLPKTGEDVITSLQQRSSAMKVTLRKIGNSVGIIIPKDVLDRMGLKVGDGLDLNHDSQSIALLAPADDFEEDLAAAEDFMDRYADTMKRLAE